MAIVKKTSAVLLALWIGLAAGAFAEGGDDDTVPGRSPTAELLSYDSKRTHEISVQIAYEGTRFYLSETDGSVFAEGARLELNLSNLSLNLPLYAKNFSGYSYEWDSVFPDGIDASAYSGLIYTLPISLLYRLDLFELVPDRLVVSAELGVNAVSIPVTGNENGATQYEYEFSGIQWGVSLDLRPFNFAGNMMQIVTDLEGDVFLTENAGAYGLSNGTWISGRYENGTYELINPFKNSITLSVGFQIAMFENRTVNVFGIGSRKTLF